MVGAGDLDLVVCVSPVVLRTVVSSNDVCCGVSELRVVEGGGCELCEGGGCDVCEEGGSELCEGVYTRLYETERRL